MVVASVRGLSALIEELDQAVQAKDTEALAEKVKTALEEHLGGGTVALPEDLCQPAPDHYARRLLHRSSRHGYTLLAMIWGPGQGTPLHDHAGMWCVEGVLRGEIEVVQHDLVSEREGRYRFEPQASVIAGVGNAGSLIPPFEYHTIRNHVPGSTAITLHVYGGEMTACTIFLPEGDGWYRRESRQLSYTA